jgi:signal transduction protein with GAF and PtsI domain
VSDQHDDSKLEIELTLESPPEPSASPIVGGTFGQLFDQESVALVAGKFAMVDAFLKAAVRDQNFTDFIREILMATMKVVKSEAGSVLEVDHSKQQIFFRATVGVSSDRLSNFEIPLGQGIVGHVAETRRPLVVANVEENRMHLKAIQNAVGFEARNLIAVPIVIRGKLYGVLELLNRVGEPEFGPNDVELLSYGCEMAAKAIESRLMIAWASRGKSSKEEAA